MIGGWQAALAYKEGVRKGKSNWGNSEVEERDLGVSYAEGNGSYSGRNDRF